MKCLRCGYCCINYAVIIVNDPKKGITEENLIVHNGNGQKCPHLRGNKPGKYSCAIHKYPWYKETPCFSHGQIEEKDSPCRIGEYVLAQESLGEICQEIGCSGMSTKCPGDPGCKIIKKVMK